VVKYSKELIILNMSPIDKNKIWGPLTIGLWVVAGIGIVSIVGTLVYLNYNDKDQDIEMDQEISDEEMEDTANREESEDQIDVGVFNPATSQILPSFLGSVGSAEDVSIFFYYEGYDAVMDMGYYTWEFSPGYSESYILEDSDEEFLLLSKIRNPSEREYPYGPDEYSIFKDRESHAYQGAPIHLFREDSEYSVDYVGLKISNRELVSDLEIEFGIDYGSLNYYPEYDYRDESLGKSEESFWSRIFGIHTVYACGPGLYFNLVGKRQLTFIKEVDGISWYRLEEPIELYNLNLDYCTPPSETMPDYCSPLEEGPMADDPYECWDYCYYNISIKNLAEGNLRMNIFYKPNDKEGFLRIQVVNLILSDLEGNYYQPKIERHFEDYYRAYFQ